HHRSRVRRAHRIALLRAVRALQTSRGRTVLSSTIDEPSQKIRDWGAAAAWRQSVSGRVVFTNGVFDLLHPGHIDVLLGARRHGTALVVGINSDESVRRLKGPER